MPAIGQADNTIEFSFDKRTVPSEDALRAAVTAAGAESEPSAESAPAETAKPAPTATSDPLTKPAASASSEESSAPSASPSATDELKTYTITVDGQEMTVTEADLKAGHMRHRDYTQKTQRLAEQQRAWETERTQLTDDLQALDNFLKSQKAIEAYMQKAFPGQVAPAAPPQIDPNQPLTHAQVAEIARYNAEQVRLSTLHDLQEARQAAQTALAQTQEIQREKVGNEIDRHIAILIDKHPILKHFDADELSEELISAASRFSPRTLDDAKARLVEAAERKVATLKAITDADKKQTAIAAAKLKQTAPEPAGGAAPRQAAGKKVTMDTKDRGARIDAGVEFVNSFLTANS